MSKEDFSIELSDNGDEEEEPEGTLTASGIAEYIRFNCCPRFFKLKFEAKEVKNRVWPEAFKPISPLLYGVGKALEEKKVAELKEKAADYMDFTVYDPKTHGKRGWEKARDSMDNLRYIIEHQLSEGEKTEQKPLLLYQVPMKGFIGVWEIKGIADLIAIWPLKEGKVKVRIFELKASWKEQTAHRIQVAIYALLLTQELDNMLSKVELEGGVINRETSLEKLDPDSLPKFKLCPLIQDVERLLAQNGELNRIRQTPIEEVEYQLCWQCETCGFNECCIVCAVENESVALLNLSRGEQKTLRHHGVTKLEDLAKLKAVTDTANLRPYDFKTIPPKDQKKVQELSTNPIIGAKLDWLIQRAQYMLGGIRLNSSNASKSRWMPWLTGTGYGNLPEDSPPTTSTDYTLGCSPNGMIRVYLFVELDYMLDVVSMLSAKVSSTRYRGEPQTISKVIASLPDDRTQGLDAERAMMEAFFKELIEAITNVANATNNATEAPIHLYFFSRQERDGLMKAVCRQPSIIEAHAVRDLLGLRQAIDQPMFSILQDEIQHRKALRFHSSGLLPILEQSGYFDHNQWRIKRKDGTLVDLALVFRDGFFNYSLPYRKNSDGTIAFLKKGEPDGYYPARARFSAQLPIEYFWGAKGRLDHFNQVKGPAKILLDKRRWCDYTQKTRRITDEELSLMGIKICVALEQIERSLSIRNRRLGKKSLAIPKIAEFSLGKSTLERSCREFLDLEYFSKRQEMYQHYAMLPYQRVASGRSLIFQCTQIEETEQEFTVWGKLIYEGLGLPKAECIANACRVKGSDESSSGDWMVVTELYHNIEGQFEETQKHTPAEVEKSARTIIEAVNIPKLEITLKVITWPRGKNSKYSAWHKLPTTDPKKAEKKFMQLFETGRYYILDELADDIISDRAIQCLDYAQNNTLYTMLSNYLAGNPSNSTHTALPKQGAESFLRWVETRQDISPKPEQKRLIDQIFNKEPIIMLQGPPGTGKTETLQLAVLAHIAAHQTKTPCRVLMVAPTHKAIQEFVTKLARCWQKYTTEGGNDLADLNIYRVLSNNTNTTTPIKGVKYLNYNQDAQTVKEITDSLTNQSTLTAPNKTSASMVLCLTPPGLYGLMKKIGDKEPPWGEDFFDLLVVDEASMMRLPELILSGSFLAKNSQIIIAGDHRQLSPIVTHNWEKEDRRTLEEMAAFLSAMDFLRLLRNDELGLERIKCKNPADIPAIRLAESHRCHTIVANFLREWVYEKDGIDFHSNQTQTLAQATPETEGLKAALEAQNIFALIVHDEAESFQSNLIEAVIVQALAKNAPTKDIGIITPHNAQKGVLKNLLQDCNCKDIRVDTVERYQGGEADAIIISSCVSDPDYVRTESEFLLNLNRINVSISRMKKKLIIIASRSIFEFMPTDARDYDKALLWRGISQIIGYTANAKPHWTGSLTQFLGKEAPKVKVEIYVNSPTTT